MNKKEKINELKNGIVNKIFEEVEKESIFNIKLVNKESEKREVEDEIEILFNILSFKQLNDIEKYCVYANRINGSGLLRVELNLYVKGKIKGEFCFYFINKVFYMLIKENLK